MSHLALTGDLNPKQRGQVDIIQNNARALVAMVNNAILDFSKLELRSEVIDFGLDQVLADLEAA